jgi:hypothetical protein
MRNLLPLLFLTATGCAEMGETPSLAPRPIEKIGMESALPASAPTGATPAADATLKQRIAALTNEAEAGDRAFADADRAGASAIVAGRRAKQGSEAWIDGEAARSALEAARQQSADALAALDTLLVARVEASGSGIAELDAAQQRVSAIVVRQNERLTALTR